MAIEKRAYGVMDVEKGTVVMLGSDENRDDAITTAQQMTERTGREFLPVERIITYGDWKPFNTGIVPPYVESRIDRQWEKGDPRVE